LIVSDTSTSQEIDWKNPKLPTTRRVRG